MFGRIFYFNEENIQSGMGGGDIAIYLKIKTIKLQIRSK